MLLSDVCMSDVCLSVYLSRTSGLSREQRGLGKTKIGTKVAHVTRVSDATFKVKRSKVKVTGGGGHIVAASRTACLVSFFCITSRIRVTDRVKVCVRVRN